MNRYHRQIRFSPLGEEGQMRLQAGGVLIIGCGALGSSAASILARSGVGRLILVDPDTVAVDNLHRQPLFSEEDAHHKVPKVVATRNVLKKANGEISLELFQERFGPENAERFFESFGKIFQVILDGTDNFATRLEMNKAAVRHGIPLITAGVCGAEGQIFTVFPGKTPCLACFHASSTANEIDLRGILPPIVQIIAAMEAMEAIKILSGHPDVVNPSLVHFDLWENHIQQIRLQGARNPQCPVCGQQKTRISSEND